MCCSCCMVSVGIVSGLIGLISGVMLGVGFYEPISGFVEKITQKWIFLVVDFPNDRFCRKNYSAMNFLNNRCVYLFQIFIQFRFRQTFLACVFVAHEFYTIIFLDEFFNIDIIVELYEIMWARCNIHTRG